MRSYLLRNLIYLGLVFLLSNILYLESIKAVEQSPESKSSTIHEEIFNISEYIKTDHVLTTLMPKNTFNFFKEVVPEASSEEHDLKSMIKKALDSNNLPENSYVLPTSSKIEIPGIDKKSKINILTDKTSSFGKKIVNSQTKTDFNFDETIKSNEIVNIENFINKRPILKSFIDQTVASYNTLASLGTNEETKGKLDAQISENFRNLICTINEAAKCEKSEESAFLWCCDKNNPFSSTFNSKGVSSDFLNKVASNEGSCALQTTLDQLKKTKESQELENVIDELEKLIEETSKLKSEEDAAAQKQQKIQYEEKEKKLKESKSRSKKLKKDLENLKQNLQNNDGSLQNAKEENAKEETNSQTDIEENQTPQQNDNSYNEICSKIFYVDSMNKALHKSGTLLNSRIASRMDLKKNSVDLCLGVKDRSGWNIWGEMFGLGQQKNDDYSASSPEGIIDLVSLIVAGDKLFAGNKLLLGGGINGFRSNRIEIGNLQNKNLQSNNFGGIAYSGLYLGNFFVRHSVMGIYSWITNTLNSEENINVTSKEPTEKYQAFSIYNRISAANKFNLINPSRVCKVLTHSLNLSVGIGAEHLYVPVFFPSTKTLQDDVQLLQKHKISAGPEVAINHNTQFSKDFQILASAKASYYYNFLNAQSLDQSQELDCIASILKPKQAFALDGSLSLIYRDYTVKISGGVSDFWIGSTKPVYSLGIQFNVAM